MTKPMTDERRSRLNEICNRALAAEDESRDEIHAAFKEMKLLVLELNGGLVRSEKEIRRLREEKERQKSDNLKLVKMFDAACSDVAKLRKAVEAMPKKRVKDAMPEPHTKHLVYRDDVGLFVATVCYGMHAPWWVPFTVDKFAPGKMVMPMEEDDQHCLWDPEALRDLDEADKN